MLPETQLKRYGKIYAASYKTELYDMNTRLKIFHSRADYDKWLHTEESDFRTRVPISRTVYEKVEKWLYKLGGN